MYRVYAIDGGDTAYIGEFRTLAEAQLASDRALTDGYAYCVIEGSGD